MESHVFFLITLKAIQAIGQHTYTWMYITYRKVIDILKFIDNDLWIFREGGFFSSIAIVVVIFFFPFSLIVLQILVLKNLREEGKKNTIYWVWYEQEILLVVFMPIYLAFPTRLQGRKGTFISDFREKKSKLQGC